MNFKKICLALFLLFLPWSVFAVEFSPYVEGDLRGGYLTIQSSENSFQSLGSFTLIPMLKWDDSLYLMPILRVQGSGSGTVVEEDAFITQSFVSGFYPVLRRNYSSGWNWEVRAIMERAVTQDTVGAPWYTGLYDYGDLGGGAQFGKSSQEGLLRVWGLGADFSDRNFPNLRTAGTASGENQAYRDYSAPKVKAFINMDLDFLSSIKYQAMFKNYGDGLRVSSSGAFLSDKRADTIQRLSLSGRLYRGLRWDLTWFAQGESLASNQGYYDADFKMFTPGFYDYQSIAGGPRLTWRPGNPLRGHRFSLAYQALSRGYQQRRIRLPDGSYRQGLRSDVEQSVRFDATLGFAKGWGFNFGASHVAARSNQAYIPVLRSNYDLTQVYAGMMYSPRRFKRAYQLDQLDPKLAKMDVPSVEARIRRNFQSIELAAAAKDWSEVKHLMRETKVLKRNLERKLKAQPKEARIQLKDVRLSNGRRLSTRGKMKPHEMRAQLNQEYLRLEKMLQRNLRPVDDSAEVERLLRYLKNEKYEKAKKSAKTLREEDSSMAAEGVQRIKFELLKPLVYQGEFERGEKVLNVMRLLDDKDPYVFQALGTVQWHLGKSKKAVSNYRQALLRSKDKRVLENILKRHR